MKKNIFIILSITTLIGCKTNKIKSWNPERTKELNSRVLGKIFGDRFLELHSSFDECGEWGGHFEIFKIYRKNDSLFSEYKYFEENCEDLYSSERKIVHEKLFYIERKKEKIIENYMVKLLSKSLKYEAPFHAGNHYTVKIDSDLKISVHDTEKEWSEYEKFKKKMLK